MDDAAHPHDHHADHPLLGTAVALILVAVFTWIFAKLDSNSTAAVLGLVALLLGVFALLWQWVLDRD